MLKFLFSCLKLLKLLSYCQGCMTGWLSSNSIYDQQIRPCLPFWWQTHSLPSGHNSSSSTKHAVFKHGVLMQELRWAMSLCVYVMVKSALAKNGDAAPFGRVPKLLDDIDYTLHFTGIFFISRPHWAVVLVAEKPKTRDWRSCVRRWHSPVF